MWEYNYTDNLLHSGVKGMRWGQRLYQNKDGSLTALGKQRYGTKGNYEKVQAAKRAASPEKLKAAKARAKAQARTEAEIEKYKKKKEEAVNGKTTDEKAPKEKKTIMSVSKEKQNTSNVIRDKRAVKKMSDAELDAALSRLQKEQKYKDMIDGENVKKGKEALSDALRNSGKQAITTVATAGFTYAGKQALKKLMGPEYEDAWNEMFGVKKSKSTSSLIDDLRNGRTRLENLNDDEIADVTRRTASESTIRDRLGLNRTNNTTTNNSTNNVSNETTSTPLSTQSRTNRRHTSRGPSVNGSIFSRSPNRHTTATTTSESTSTRHTSRGPSVNGSTFSRSPNRHTTTSNLPSVDQTLRGTVESSRRRRATRGPRAYGIRPTRSSSTQLAVRNNRWW